ncbi:MAG: cytochrome C oxidase subunit I [Burkholderiales bacterium]|nr:MAG: cytochrome C oxidase subunit I [Burkholderiales bacterium]
MTPVGRSGNAGSRRRRWPLYLLIAIGLAPVIASYFAYYVIQPGGRTNYGTLLEPQIDLPPLELRTLDGTRFDLERLRGRWIMLMADRAGCAGACQRKLYLARQIRLTTGKEQERIERVWIVTDDAPVAPSLLREYEGMHVVRADPARLDFLPVEAPAQTRLTDHIYMVDPLGHLMMRFPADPDPGPMKRDVAKLVRATAGWIMIEPEPASNGGD